jgi:hypothetical protein
LHESNDAPRQEALDYLDSRFGVPAACFLRASFAETADGEIWISTDSARGELRTRRPSGLRALRRTPLGLKPTSAFLVSIGPFITGSRIDVDRAALRLLALGRRIPCAGRDGYVALAHDGAVVGCGLLTDGTVNSLIPTGRRRELLDILDAPQSPTLSEV